LNEGSRRKAFEQTNNDFKRRQTMASTTQQNTKKRVEIDFMFLDLEVCTRCRDTDSNLEAALETVGSILQSAGVEVLVRKKLVDSEQKAMELGFVSSPTIRVNGRDIALEFRESSCASCGEACACEGNIDCRVWIHQGHEYTAAPAPMIVNAILAAVYGTMEAAPASVQIAPVPENLKRFFAAKSAKAQSACCSTEEQETCCAPSEKSSCCAPIPVGAQPASCGCQ
jgi:hypothetical protein